MKNKAKIVTILFLSFSFFNFSIAADGETTNTENEVNNTQKTETENTTNENQTESLENEINKVEVIGDNKVKIFLKENINFKDSYVNGEFKILKSIKVDSSTKVSDKVIKLILSENLEKNSSYNVLDINGNGTIDFDTKENLINETIKNTSQLDSSIESVKIIDPQTIELNFKDPIKTEDFAFNIFEIMKIGETKGDSASNSIELTLNKNLEKNGNYILTILDLKTSEGNKIEFSDSGYKEFTNSPVEQETETLTNGEVEDEQTAQTALNTEQTPDTGTATNVLLFLTFLLSTIYFIYSRKKI